MMQLARQAGGCSSSNPVLFVPRASTACRQQQQLAQTWPEGCHVPSSSMETPARWQQGLTPRCAWSPPPQNTLWGYAGSKQPAIRTGLHLELVATPPPFAIINNVRQAHVLLLSHWSMAGPPWAVHHMPPGACGLGHRGMSVVGGWCWLPVCSCMCAGSAKGKKGCPSC